MLLRPLIIALDLGPEGGDRGGIVIAAGTPEDICGISASNTGILSAKSSAG
jgi:excinuclease UvrABC ATPase subunit